MNFYQRLCRFWAVTFAFAGLAFVFAPARVAAFIDQLAAMLTLTPGIAAARASLWFPLAASLMATLTYLAWIAGRRDSPATIHHALVLSKLASTVGFAVLALQLVSAWWICAATDGFIAVTLVLARPSKNSGFT